MGGKREVEIVVLLEEEPDVGDLPARDGPAAVVRP